MWRPIVRVPQKFTNHNIIFRLNVYSKTINTSENNLNVIKVGKKHEFQVDILIYLTNGNSKL